MKDLIQLGVGVLFISKLLKSEKNARYGNPKMRCPKATVDVDLNTANRQNTIDNYMYGPPNPARPSEWYWLSLARKIWNIPQRQLKNKQTREKILKDIKSMRCGNCVAFDISPRMEDCMPGIVSSPMPQKPNSNAVDETWDDRGADKLGYCWMHHFKCHSARTCSTWAAGGPITKDSVSYEWQKRAMKV